MKLYNPVKSLFLNQEKEKRHEMECIDPFKDLLNEEVKNGLTQIKK